MEIKFFFYIFAFNKLIIIFNKKKKKMKKLVFVATLMVAMSFAACGGKTASNQAATDSDSIAVVDSIDSVTVDSVVVK